MTIKYTPVQLKFDAKNLNYNQNGYLQVDALVAKEGIVSRIDNKTGMMRNEYISQDALFSDSSMNSMMGLPVTQRHPFIDNKPILLDTQTTKMFQKGFSIGKPEKYKQDGQNYLKIPLMLTDAQLIKDVVSGATPTISLGYTSEDIPQNGKFDGKDYNFVQTNRINNHIAFYPEDLNRSGNDVRVKLDGETDDFIYYDEVKGETKKMAMIKLDSKEYEVSDVAQLAIETKIKNDAKTISDLQTAIQKAEGERDTYRAKAEEYQDTITKLDGFKSKFEKQELETLQKEASSILGNEFKFDGLSSLEIKKAVLAKAKPSLDISKENESYINGRYEAVIESAKYDANDRQAFDVKAFGQQLQNNLNGGQKSVNTQADAMFARIGGKA